MALLAQILSHSLQLTHLAGLTSSALPLVSKGIIEPLTSRQLNGQIVTQASHPLQSSGLTTGLGLFFKLTFPQILPEESKTADEGQAIPHTPQSIQRDAEI